MKTEALQVELADRSYPIHFDTSIQTLAATVQRLRDAGQSIAAIADQGLAPHLKLMPSTMTRTPYRNPTCMSRCLSAAGLVVLQLQAVVSLGEWG